MNNDLTFYGEMPGEMWQKIISLDESATANRIYAIYATTEVGFPYNHPERAIRRFKADRTLLNMIPLPEFLIPDGMGDGELYPGNG